MKYVTTLGTQEYVVEILDETHMVLNGRSLEVDFTAIAGQSVYSLLVDGHSYEAYVYPDDGAWQVLLHGRMFPARVQDEREHQAGSNGSSPALEREFHLKAPMPGLIVAVPVAEGQPVQKGDVLVILESMKMQNELKAPRSGVVTRLKVDPGQRVEQKQILLSVI